MADPRHVSTAQLGRRLPPPCWTAEETAALIAAYADTWRALRRGNLRAAHWDDVAAAVARRCRPVYDGNGPIQSRPKTAVQCRHKMEKLRKRYRSEAARPHRAVAWAHFSAMHALESPPPASPLTAVTVAVPPPSAEEKRERGRDDGTDDVAEAVRRLGEGFVRAEMGRIEMARSVHRLRIEAEMRRTETMIEAQRWVLEAFLAGLGARERRVKKGGNKKKRTLETKKIKDEDLMRA